MNGRRWTTSRRDNRIMLRPPMDALSAHHVPPKLELMPAQEACDYDHSRSALADRENLRRSIALRIHDTTFLAVPLGGRRRGGYLFVCCTTAGLLVRDVLKGPDGFPNRRLSWSPYTDTCHVVRWSEPEASEWCDDTVCGCFYGYRAVPIFAFTPPQSAHTPAGDVA